MATRKKAAAGTAPAAAQKPATVHAAAPVEQAGTEQGAQTVVGQQQGQTASALAAPVLDIGAPAGGVISQVVLGDGYPEDIEMGGRALMVQSRSARGRWRIGRHFTTAPSAVVVDELTEDELGRLLADPELIVSLDD